MERNVGNMTENQKWRIPCRNARSLRSRLNLIDNHVSKPRSPPLFSFGRKTVFLAGKYLQVAHVRRHFFLSPHLVCVDSEEELCLATGQQQQEIGKATRYRWQSSRSRRHRGGLEKTAGRVFFLYFSWLSDRPLYDTFSMVIQWYWEIYHFFLVDPLGVVTTKKCCWPMGRVDSSHATLPSSMPARFLKENYFFFLFLLYIYSDFYIWSKG